MMNLANTGGGPCQLHFSMGEKELLSISRFYLEIILYRWLCYQLFSLFLSVCRSIAGGLFSPLRPYYCKLKVQDAWDTTIKTIGVKLSRRGRLTQERKREGDRETERGLRDNFPNRIFVPAMREVDFFSEDD